MTFNLESSSRINWFQIYQTWPFLTLFLLEYGNERWGKAEILRADPLVVYLNWITIVFKFESRRLRPQLHEQASPVAAITLVEIPARSPYSM